MRIFGLVTTNRQTGVRQPVAIPTTLIRCALRFRVTGRGYAEDSFNTYWRGKKVN
ncbi:hypothetical protein [Prevotella sp. kh1p2]|uniref:hypothetical protein n=1 Tax=Prevotella sp. kh1p2 TaxID=1761883 RepID=UPI0015A572E0|nr:hypothetical protein [Prevotella sp. kh1p2]